MSFPRTWVANWVPGSKPSTCYPVFWPSGTFLYRIIGGLIRMSEDWCISVF
jgi:hypothetical protein